MENKLQQIRDALVFECTNATDGNYREPMVLVRASDVNKITDAIYDLDEIIAAKEQPVQESHCKDCCCARCWDALGITEYTGKSIPEHITELREATDLRKVAYKAASERSDAVIENIKRHRDGRSTEDDGFAFEAALQMGFAIADEDAELLVCSVTALADLMIVMGFREPMRESGGWKPMDTAPRDGTPILARYEYMGKIHSAVVWSSHDAWQGGPVAVHGVKLLSWLMAIPSIDTSENGRRGSGNE